MEFKITKDTDQNELFADMAVKIAIQIADCLSKTELKDGENVVDVVVNINLK